jgi:uncharacterized membrane protein required for colicin V production
MIFALIVIALIVAVAMYHYIQGFFSAMISATLTVLAVLIAFAYYEPLAESLLITHLPNVCHALALVALFSFSYLALRLIVDRIVPGNIRIPVIVDKVGAGAFGAIAGLLAAGVFAVAAQILPFYPSIAGYSRYPVADREVHNVRIPGRVQLQELVIYNELKEDSLDPSRSSSLMIPVDSMVLGIVGRTSEGVFAGAESFAGRSFANRHPDLLTELFSQRLGVPYGFPRVAYSLKPEDAFRASAVFAYDNRQYSPPKDYERKDIREDRPVTIPQFPDDYTLIVVRAIASPEGERGLINFAPSNVRLVVAGEQTFPIGILQKEDHILLTRADDPLFMTSGKPVDYVFAVRRNAFVTDDKAARMPPNSFIEYKRGARSDLSGKVIEGPRASRSGEGGILEKTAP